MKTTRIYALFALLLIAAGSKLQAQQPKLEEIIQFDESFLPRNMCYVNDEDVLVMDERSSPQSINLLKLKDDGTVIASAHYSETNAHYNYRSEFMRRHDGTVGFFFSKTVGSTSTFHFMTVDEDMTLSVQDLEWECDDFVLYDFWEARMTSATIFKDGSMVISYIPENLWNLGNVMGVRLLKFDTEGALLQEKIWHNSQFYYFCGMVPAADSLGCRIMLYERTPEGPCYVNGYHLDSDLNTVYMKTNINNKTYPIMISDGGGRYRANPYNGKLYAIGSVSCPAINQQPEISKEILMIMFDTAFVEQKDVWGAHRRVTSEGREIVFCPDGDVYFLGEMDWYLGMGPLDANFYVAWLDENMNKKGEIYYHNEQRGLCPRKICACPQGGCLVSLEGWDRRTYAEENVIYKISKGVLTDIEEAHDAGFVMAVAYPNPGKEVLNIRTGLQDSWVEVYDLDGRLVHREAITENVTGIDAGDWADGVYVWKVVSNGKEAENGKWIKE